MNLSAEDRAVLERLTRKHHGHKTTPESKARGFGAPHPTTAVFAYPTADSLRSFLPANPFNQGPSSTCFAHAQASLIVLCLAAAGTPLAWVPSPLGIGRNTYCEEQPLGIGSAALLADVGADMGDVMTATAREGVRPIGPLAPGRFSDVTPANIVTRPTLADDELAAAELLLGSQQLQPSAADFLPQLANAVANMRCGVSIGLHSSPAFEAWFDSPPAGFAPFTDLSGFTDTDGHDTALADYRTEADGSLSFWLRSSWGEGGDDGGIWVSGAWLAGGGCMEAWRMKVVASVASQAAA